MKILYLILTLAAIGSTIWYTAFYQSPTPGATYSDTYAYISIGAAIIFSGLLLAGFLNREQSRANVLLE